MECQRLRTETWAKTANRKRRAAALSGHCWKDLCKAPVNESSRQLKTSPLSHATWRVQAQCNLMKREAKQRQQIAVRWCHVNVPADSIIYIFFSHTGSFESTTDQAQSESHKAWRDNRTQWRKKKARRRPRRKSLCFIYLSIHSFKAGHGISSFYAIGKRKWHVQGNQWRQRVKDAGWQLRQLITLEKPERQQRMKVISDSRLGYRLVPMPLVAWGKISKRWLNLDSLSKEQQQLYKSALGEETVVIHIVIASEHNQQMVDSSPACAGHITKRRKLSSEDDID